MGILDVGIKVSKGAKIRNRYNQVPHLTQDANGKVTNSQPDIANESQYFTEISHADRCTINMIHIKRDFRSKACVSPPVWA